MYAMGALFVTTEADNRLAVTRDAREPARGRYFWQKQYPESLAGMTLRASRSSPLVGMDSELILVVVGVSRDFPVGDLALVIL